LKQNSLSELELLLFESWLGRSPFESLCLLGAIGPCDSKCTELFIWVDDCWSCLLVSGYQGLLIRVVFNYYHFCFLAVGFHFRRRILLLWPIVIFSVVAILSLVTYLVIWAAQPMSQSVPQAWWAKLIGFMMWDYCISHLFLISPFISILIC